MVRDLIVEKFLDPIRRFGILSPLVDALDQVIGNHCFLPVIPEMADSFFGTKWNLVLQELLKIENDRQLQQLLVKNTPYLTVRADQVMEGSITLWLALFSDTEFLNKEIIEQTWKSVNFAPTVERYYRYVQQLNALRALRIYHATSQHDYSCAARNTQGEFEPKFRFVDGCCEFDVYSNGINEEANTTRLNEVIHALPDVLEARL